jgi:hypothetical protein
MSEQTIYYKLENVRHVSKFLKKTGATVLQISIDHSNGETQILHSEAFCNLTNFLVCPASEFNNAFKTAMLKCEVMQCFPLFGLDMSPKLERQVIQRTTEVKENAAQQFNQSY